MHLRAAAMLTLALWAGCPGAEKGPSPVAPSRAHHDANARAEVPPPTQNAAVPAPTVLTPAVPQQGPEASAKIHHELLTLTLSAGEAQVHHFTIPLASAELAYVDLKYQTPLVEALSGHDLVLNGGYWGYRGQQRVIMGLLVVNGQAFSPQHKHGGVLEVRQGIARVVRGEDFTLAPDTTLAVQCSPRLVDAGEPIPKLESRRVAPRTALCVTRERSQLEAYLTETPITLPELALFLTRAGCYEALNLDGGPSTAAVARLRDGVLTIGHGEALPYGLGFTIR